MIGVNRKGTVKSESYVPSSHIYDCLGNDIAERVSEELLVAELDPAVIEKSRKVFPQAGTGSVICTAHFCRTGDENAYKTGVRFASCKFLPDRVQ